MRSIACLLLLALLAVPVLAQDSEEPLFLVINYPYQITGEGRTKIHVVLFKPDFTPAAGAEVTVGERSVGRTDENGTCIFDFAPGNTESHSLVARLVEGERTWKVVKPFQSNARTESFRSDQLYVYTDRGLYNPGDTVRVRLVAWELLGDYKAIPDAEVSILIQSPGGKVYGGRVVTTNRFGVGATEIPLARTMPEGNYEIVVLYQEAREAARIRIQPFVPPVIRIDHDLKRWLTPAQDEVAVTATLSYFAGGEIRSSKLRLRVLDDAGEEILAFDVAEDAPGRYAFELGKERLDAIREAIEPETPFQIVLEATDSYGRTSSVTRDVVYTARPFRAVLEFDKDDYPPGEAVQLLAKVVDLDGKPASGLDLVCRVEEINVEAKATTDEKGVATFSFEMGEAAGTAVVTTAAMAEPLATKAVRLNEPKPMVSKVSEPPTRQGIRTRIRVDFDLAYVPIEKVVHVDLTDVSGALVAATTIPVERDAGGRWVAGGTVEAPTWGTMLVNLYCCAITRETHESKAALSTANVGFITEGQHVTLYPDAEALVVVRGLAPRVRPGDEVEFEVEVETKSGSEAALGVALVDRAVVSLLDPFEVTPMDRFYNPRLKTISTGGAAVLTWPVVDRNWGEPWRDIAYMNWGWKAPGAPVGAGGGDEHAPAEDAAPAEKPAHSGDLKKANGGGAGAAFGEEAEESADAEGARDERGGGGEADAPARRITIRTRFPETAFWEPLLVTEGGKARLRIRVPDAITVQRLSIVASDASGSIGLAIHDVEVRQEVFVRADAPAAIARGDTTRVVALVSNRSGGPLETEVALEADGLEVDGAEARRIAVPDGESAAVEWTVRGSRIGAATYTVIARAGSFEDRETGRVLVRPAGEPRIDLVRGTLSGAAPWRTSIATDPGATHREAVLSIAFPNAIGALGAWQAMRELPVAWVGPLGVAHRALSDAALLEWALGADPSGPLVATLRDRLARAAIELASVQQPDGGWGWFYLADASSDRPGYRSTAYTTVQALRALTAIREADLVVDDACLEAAAAYLLGVRGEHGLWSAEGSFFWEVHAPEADAALSAEVFAVLVDAGRARGGEPREELAGLAERIREILRTRPDEPAAIAHAARGLLAWSRWRGARDLEAEVSGAIDHLVRLQRDGHWEPHWYHTYGGRVELAATILELLREVDPEARAGVVRETLTYLLSTRESWGAWHNEAGTIVAVRALLAAGAGAVPEVASEVVVALGGREVARIAIDPADPFLSAASLRHVDLTSALAAAGSGPALEVRYGGRLTASVLVELRQWGVEPASGTRPGPLGLGRRAPERTALGEPAEVALTIRATEPVGPVEVVDRVPSNATADEPSLAALVESGRIAAYRIEPDRVVLVLAKVDGETTLTYRITGSTPGTAIHPGTTARIAGRDDPPPAASIRGTPLTVD